MSFGITTPFSVLDKKSEKLREQFYRELNSKVLDANGTVVRPTRDVMNEILPKYLSRVAQDTRLSFQDQAAVVQTFLGPVPQLDDKAFPAWASQAGQKVEALKATDPNGYAVRRQQLVELLRHYSQAIKAQQSQQQNKASSGGYKPNVNTAPSGETGPAQ